MRLKYISGLKKSKIKLQRLTGEERSVFVQILGNLITTTKFMTKTSVDWERSLERERQFRQGKGNLKMQTVSRLTTMTLNVKTNVKL